MCFLTSVTYEPFPRSHEPLSTAPPFAHKPRCAALCAFPNQPPQAWPGLVTGCSDTHWVGREGWRRVEWGCSAVRCGGVGRLTFLHRIFHSSLCCQIFKLVLLLFYPLPRGTRHYPGITGEKHLASLRRFTATPLDQASCRTERIFMVSSAVSFCWDIPGSVYKSCKHTYQFRTVKWDALLFFFIFYK